MNRLPPEIIEIIGQFLDGPALVISLQVCRWWHHIFSPIAWTSISRKQWHHSTFPIQQSGPIHFVTQLGHKLLRVRRMEYFSNSRLKGRYAASTSITLRRELSKLRLAKVFQSCVNLTFLSLSMDRDDHVELSFLRDLTQLQHLKRLDVDIVVYCRHPMLRLEDMFPLLERLEVLSLAGTWYMIDHEKLSDPHLHIDRPWQMKKLKISTYASCLLRYCPELQQLELQPSDHWMQVAVDMSSSILTFCPKLEVLDVTRCRRQWKLLDIIDTETLLKGLKSLAFVPHSLEQLGFLCMPAQYTDFSQRCVETDTMALPQLEHLEIHPLVRTQHVTRPTVADAVQDLFMSILQTRPGLKSFIVRNHRIDPSNIFVQPGLDHQKQEWACKDLEGLSLELRSTGNLKTKEERLECWQSIYRQLGLLTRLKHVSIFCNGIEHSTEAGIQQLAGAKDLRTLSLLDDRNVQWTKDETQDLVQMFPRLTHLTFWPGNAAQVREWLCESERELELTLHDDRYSFRGASTSNVSWISWLLFSLSSFF